MLARPGTWILLITVLTTLFFITRASPLKLQLLIALTGKGQPALTEYFPARKTA